MAQKTDLRGGEPVLVHGKEAVIVKCDRTGPAPPRRTFVVKFKDGTTTRVTRKAITKKDEK